jgi:hypothetical protein
MARTAVVAGTATAVSNRVSRRQYNRWADQGQQFYPPRGYMGDPQQAAPPPPPPPPPTPPPADAGEDRIAQLKQLADLHTSGVLTDEEFAAEKARILGG